MKGFVLCRNPGEIIATVDSVERAAESPTLDHYEFFIACDEDKEKIDALAEGESMMDVHGWVWTRIKWAS